MARDSMDKGGDGPVIVYVRPWSRAQFVHLAGGVWPDVPLVEVSEHAAFDKGGLKAAFYRAHAQITASDMSPHLNEAEIADVILRCRLLRMIPERTARHLLLACERAIDEIIDKERPRAMLSVTTDSYIQHLFVLACRRRGIPFIGLVPSFVNGHFRVTALGERVAARTVTDDQVAAVTAQLLTPGYVPDFLVKSPRQLLAKARRLWWRNLLKPGYFAARRVLSGDRLNYHSWSTYLVSRQFWSLRLQTYVGAVPRRREDLPPDPQNRPVVFLPLQMSPEATIDYWSADTSWIDFETRVLRLLETHRDSVRFLIKEHPNLVGFRSPGFYDRIAAHPNAILIDPAVPSNDLLSMCDGVVICTGTVGFEAALRGIPVFTDSEPFHLPHGVARSLAELEGLQMGGQAQVDTADLVRHALEGMLPGTFINDGTWSAETPPHLEGQRQMIDSLKRYAEGLAA